MLIILHLMKALSHTREWKISFDQTEINSLERLEKEFYVSKYHIEHVFKDDFGISMHKFIQMKRLYACRDAIGSGKPIQETFPLYGFNDYSVFFRAFKKEFGLSPKEYQMIQR